ncbi:MAG: TauD/TfdA family dioxygenase [Pseudomonadota bacterium]
MSTSAAQTLSPSTETMTCAPLRDDFGTLISGVDAATASDETLKKVVDQFERTGAIVLRDQKMQPEDLKHFLRQFGELEGHTLQEYTLPGHPEIYILSNIVENGRPIGAHNDGVGWHTDYSYKEKPVKCTMLYAVEVPAEGSDTLLADCCAAYDALPTDRREKLEGLKLHHSYKFFMENREHGRMKLPPEIERANPDVVHPLIRTHPANGRKALWPSTGTVKEVIGMPGQEGLDMLDELIAFVTQDQFVYRHKWQVGDLVLWDNRCTLHTGTLFDDKKYRRLMHRMWAKGGVPY